MKEPIPVTSRTSDGKQSKSEKNRWSYAEMDEKHCLRSRTSLTHVESVYEHFESKVSRLLKSESEKVWTKERRTLRPLCVLSVSAVRTLSDEFHRRDAKYAEVSQRNEI